MSSSTYLLLVFGWILYDEIVGQQLHTLTFVVHIAFVKSGTDFFATIAKVVS